MALVKALTFETGATTGSDAFDTVEGTTGIESTSPILGSYSFRASTSSNSSGNYGRVNLAADSDTLAASFYVRFASLGLYPIFGIHRSGFLTPLELSVRMNNSGGIEFDGFAQDSEPIETGVLYRIDVIFRNNTPTGTARRYLAVTNMETNNTEVVTDDSTLETSQVRHIRVGMKSGVVFDEIHVRDDDTLPELPGGGPQPVEMAARGGVALGARAALQVTRVLSGRGGVVAGGRAAILTGRSLTARGAMVLGGRASLQVGLPELTGRGGLLLGGRARLQVERHLTARGGLVLGGRGQFKPAVSLAVRGGLVLGGRGRLARSVRLKARGGVALGGRASLDSIADYVTPFQAIEFQVAVHPTLPLPVERAEVEFQIALEPDAGSQLTQHAEVEFQIRVHLADRYIGPGSGIKTDRKVPLLQRVREGDRFPTLFAQAGVEGMSGISHVLSRSVESGRDLQDLTVQPVIPDDPRNEAAVRRGDPVVVRPPESGRVTRQVERQRRQRQLDNRRRMRRER